MAKKLKKKEIGKGIRALLNAMDSEDTQLKNPAGQKDSETSIRMIPLSVIEVNPDQPRRHFDPKSLEELAGSIRTFGLIQPITLRKLSSDTYQIISGERRSRAAAMAGLTEVPAYIRTANDQELLEMGLVENIQREDLNPLDIAISYQRLIDECNLTHEVLSTRIGKQRSTITNYLRLLKLPPEIQRLLKEEMMTMGHARALAGLDDISYQLMLSDKVIRNNWSVRQLEREIKNLQTPKKKKNTITVSDQVKSIQNNLKMTLGAPVSIKQTPKGSGKIEIRFQSSDHLNDILDILESLD